MNLKKYLTLLAITLALTAVYAEDKPAVEEPKKSLWEHSIALGLTMTKGNSDTLTGTGVWLSLKKWDKNELRFGADGTYGTTSETVGTTNKTTRTTTTAQSGRVYGQYNRLFTEKLYGYLRAELYHDAIADINYRFMVSPGAGYYFIKDPSTQLAGELGPGWVYQKKGGVTDNYFTLRIAERFEHKFSERVRIWENVEFLPQVDDWENFIVNGEVGVESSLSKKLGLRVFVQDTYENKPAAGRKNNDVKLVVALAYKF